MIQPLRESHLTFSDQLRLVGVNVLSELKGEFLRAVVDVVEDRITVFLVADQQLPSRLRTMPSLDILRLHIESTEILKK